MLQACHLVFNILIMLTFLKQDAYICAVVGNCQIYVKGKGKVFPYSLPSVGPGADPGVQAVSPQVT